jgi:hypothetical protein
MSLFIFLTIVQALIAAALVGVISSRSPKAAAWAWAAARPASCRHAVRPISSPA